MTFNRIIIILLVLLAAGCGGGGGSPAPAQPATPTVTSITVTPASPVIAPGGTLQFTATATLSDNTTQDVTSSVAWSSSNTGVASITPAGLATTGAAGKATISAALGSKSDATSVFAVAAASTPANQLAITVDGSLCSDVTSTFQGQIYFNKPCVSVTVCSTDNSNCQTIGDILLDTGSYGLRIFKQALTVPLDNVAGAPGLAECVGFADGSSSWGPVKIAGVKLGGEAAVSIPIQVIDSTFGNKSLCGTPDVTPAAAGYSGILGVGLFKQDCGPGCASNAANRFYFTCNGSSCTGAAVALQNQVANPVAALSQDNNGVVVKIPAVPDTGAPSQDGTLLFGVGTASNNTPPNTTTQYAVDLSGNFPTFFTTISGTTIRSFLDTGSNGIFVPRSLGLFPTCGSDPSWFCPSTTPPSTGFATVNVTNSAAVGPASGNFNFTVGNFDILAAANNGNNRVFNDLAGPSAGGNLDWGLPFFLGRPVFMGFEDNTGNNAFWQY